MDAAARGHTPTRSRRCNSRSWLDMNAADGARDMALVLAVVEGHTEAATALALIETDN